MVSNGNLRKRYASRRLYEGSLREDEGLSWLHRTRPYGLSYPCRLPECRTLLVRTQERRPRWYCTDEHAADARARRAVLRDRISSVEGRLGDLPRGANGRYTTEEGRELASDLVFLRGILEQYG